MCRNGPAAPVRQDDADPVPTVERRSRGPGRQREGKIDHGNRLDRPLMGAQPPVTEPTTLDPAGAGRVHPVPADALPAGASVLDALPAGASVLDALPDAIIVMDPASLRFCYANRGATELLGYSRDELMRMTPRDVGPLHAEQAYRDLLAPLPDPLSPRTFGTVWRRRDGELVRVEVSLRHVRSEGGEGRLIAVVRDLTGRADGGARVTRPLPSEQAAAAGFATMIAAVGDAVVVCGPGGRVTHSNQAARALFGEGLAYWGQVLERLDDPGGEAPVPGRCERQGPVQLRYRDGQEQWLSLTAHPVMGEGATCGAAPAVATIVLVQDVSDARRTRQAREAFMGVLSHELRTPVTTIYAGSKVLGGAGGSLTPAVRQEVYRDIAAESERLYRLVEDLLVLARFDGVAPGSIGDEPVLLQRILPDVIDLERIRFPDTRFDVDLPAGLPTVRAERTYVAQIARNLLTNAARYSPPGSTVRLELAAAADLVEIRVLDEGPGFPADEAGRLFDLFYRSETTSRITGGAGIGLFVCRRLVEAMGGRVWARPRSGGGSEFGFALRTFTEEEM